MYSGILQNKTAKIYSETCLKRKLDIEACRWRKTFNDYGNSNFKCPY